MTHKGSTRNVTQGPKTRRFRLQNTFIVSKYLVSNLSYTHLIRTIKKVKKTNKKFNIFRVIIIVLNRYFIILKLSNVMKGFILCQTKQTTLKSGCNFTNTS